jgi:hypothetical protein
MTKVVNSIAIEILKESLRKGKSITIPSLNLSLNPDGSVTSLNSKLAES